MPCDINIEDRYRLSAIRHRQCFNTGLITAAAITTAGALAGGAISYAGATSAARQQAAAAGKLTKEQRKIRDQAMAQLAAATGALKKNLADIPAPQWNVARDIKDAGQITDYNVRQLEKIFPGARSQREIAARATTSYLRGEIPKDVESQIMRSVAEMGGAGFTPTQSRQEQPSGFQVPQAMLARSIGETSLGLQQLGQQLSQGWQKLSAAFIESPLAVGQARLQFEQAAADLGMQKAAAIYNAQAAQATMGYNTGIQVSNQAYGMTTDSIASRLAANQALASGIQGVTGAIGGGLTGISQARQMQQMAQALTGTQTLAGRFQPFGEMASREQFAQGMRGYGIAGSVQNLLAGQLGRPATASIMPSNMLKSPY